MQPIGLTVKQRRNKYENDRNGELMLIHQCSECGRFSINRIAADDWSDRLMEIFHTASRLDPRLKQQLAASEIHLLLEEDVKLVVSQIYGNIQN
jgi:hypothetical protein